MKKTDSMPYLWRCLPLLAPLLGVVFALMLVVPAWAATVTNIEILFNLVVFTCPGVIVPLSGVEHVTSQVTQNPDGTFSVTMHDNAHLTGTAEGTGTPYVAELVDNFQLNNVHVVQGQAQIENFPIISKGSTSNFFGHSVLHCTVNANGTVTATVDQFRATCTG